MADLKYKDVGDFTIRLAEECAEVIHIICKIERFDLHNYHPDDPKQTPNGKVLLAEIADLQAVIDETVNILEQEYYDSRKDT